MKKPKRIQMELELPTTVVWPAWQKRQVSAAELFMFDATMVSLMLPALRAILAGPGHKVVDAPRLLEATLERVNVVAGGDATAEQCAAYLLRLAGDVLQLMLGRKREALFFDAQHESGRVN